MTFEKTNTVAASFRLQFAARSESSAKPDALADALLRRTDTQCVLHIKRITVRSHTVWAR